MIITKLEVQAKHKDRVSIYVDGEFYCGMTLFSAMKYHLKEGVEIDKERLDFLKETTENENACEKGLKYLSKAQKTEKELRTYLLSKGFDSPNVNYAISKLKEYEYINDEKYAKNYIKFKSNTEGKKKIEFELKNKGIKDAIIQKSFEEFTFDDAPIRKLAEKYLSNKQLDIKTKQKAYRYLASKGFSSEEIMPILNDYFNE